MIIIFNMNWTMNIRINSNQFDSNFSKGEAEGGFQEKKQRAWPRRELSKPARWVILCKNVWLWWTPARLRLSIGNGLVANPEVPIADRSVMGLFWRINLFAKKGKQTFTEPTSCAFNLIRRWSDAPDSSDLIRRLSDAPDSSIWFADYQMRGSIWFADLRRGARTLAKLRRKKNYQMRRTLAKRCPGKEPSEGRSPPDSYSSLLVHMCAAATAHRCATWWSSTRRGSCYTLHGGTSCPAPPPGRGLCCGSAGWTRSRQAHCPLLPGGGSPGAPLFRARSGSRLRGCRRPGWNRHLSGHKYLLDKYY